MLHMEPEHANRPGMYDNYTGDMTASFQAAFRAYDKGGQYVVESYFTATHDGFYYPAEVEERGRDGLAVWIPYAIKEFDRKFYNQ